MKKEKINLYYLFVSLVALRTWLSITRIIQSPALEMLLNVFILANAVVLYFGQKHTKKEIGISIILCLLFGYTALQTNSQLLLLIPMLIILSKNMDPRKVIRILLVINLTMLSLHLIYFAINYLFSPESITYMVDEKGSRYNFFLRHPNYASAVILWSVASYLYLKKEMQLSKKILLVFITMIFAYLFTKSRTTLIGFLLLLFIYIIYQNNFAKQWIRQITKFIFPLLSIALILLLLNYENWLTITSQINELLNGRIKLAYIVYLEYGSTIIGQFVDFTDSILVPGKYLLEELIIDSFYLACFINYGWIYLILLSTTIYFYCKRTTEKEIIYLLLFIVVCVTEKYVIFPTIVFPLLLLGNYLLYPPKKEYNIEEKRKQIKEGEQCIGKD